MVINEKKSDPYMYLNVHFVTYVQQRHIFASAYYHPNSIKIFHHYIHSFGEDLIL
jgi:hypothetical protein